MYNNRKEKYCTSNKKYHVEKYHVEKYHVEKYHV